MCQITLPASAHLMPQTLRLAAWVRRVLALYLCTLVVVLVSPWVNAHQLEQAFPTPALEQICTDDAVQGALDSKSSQATDHSAHLAIQHLLDCPMCLPAALPAFAQVTLAQSPRVSIIPGGFKLAALPAACATPFLARAPPV